MKKILANFGLVLLLCTTCVNLEAGRQRVSAVKIRNTKNKKNKLGAGEVSKKESNAQKVTPAELEEVTQTEAKKEEQSDVQNIVAHEDAKLEEVEEELAHIVIGAGPAVEEENENDVQEEVELQAPQEEPREQEQRINAQDMAILKDTEQEVEENNEQEVTPELKDAPQEEPREQEQRINAQDMAILKDAEQEVEESNKQEVTPVELKAGVTYASISGRLSKEDQKAIESARPDRVFEAIKSDILYGPQFTKDEELIKLASKKIDPFSPSDIGDKDTDTPEQTGKKPEETEPAVQTKWFTTGNIAIGAGAGAAAITVAKCISYLVKSNALRDLAILEKMDPKKSYGDFENLVSKLRVVPQDKLFEARAQGRLKEYITSIKSVLKKEHEETGFVARLLSGLQADMRSIKNAAVSAKDWVSSKLSKSSK